MKYTVLFYFFICIYTPFLAQAQRDTTTTQITEADSTAQLIQKDTTSQATQQKFEILLGSTPVTILLHQKEEHQGITYFNMHDDENTAVDAALELINKQKGRFAELQHSGKRLIVFEIDSVKYRADPNRIFTKKGIEATLHFYGDYSEEAQTEVECFAQELIKIVINNNKFVVAMHNNQNSKAFSIKSFQGEERYSKEAKAVYINENMDTGEFFYVLDTTHFEYFKQNQMSVVLQEDSTFTDDGSLSVYCTQNGIPYINVEAQHEHLNEQVAMLEKLQKLLDIFLEEEEKKKNALRKLKIKLWNNYDWLLGRW